MMRLFGVCRSACARSSSSRFRSRAQRGHGRPTTSPSPVVHNNGGPAGLAICQQEAIQTLNIHAPTRNFSSVQSEMSREDDGNCSSDEEPRTIVVSSSSDEDKNDDVASLVKEYSKKAHTPASIQMLTGRQGDLLGGNGGVAAVVQNHSAEAGGALSMGRLGRRLAAERMHMQLASFLRHEIPIRLAHRIQDLDQVPMLKDMPSVLAVKDVYLNSFLEIVNFPPIDTTSDEAAFATCIEKLYTNHAGVLVQMARGAFELRAAMRNGEIISSPRKKMSEPGSVSAAAAGELLEFETLYLCHSFLDRFYSSRIGIRVLVGQYLALRHRHQKLESLHEQHRQITSEQQQQQQQYIGMVCLQTSPSQVVRHAVRDATSMCRRKYKGRAPQVKIEGQLDLTFPFIPTYLHYILLELLKNALRATAEAHMDKTILPPVTVVIADGQDNEDVVIKIMDEGGGIRRSQMSKVWSYLYTTADPSIQEAFISDKQQDHDNVAPIAGLGYGLPIARAYCRHFGGNLDLLSMEGFGTDAFIHLKRLGDAKEPVPI
jgi:pyruvate dehydrogenase kinase 2/3/4